MFVKTCHFNNSELSISSPEALPDFSLLTICLTSVIVIDLFNELSISFNIESSNEGGLFVELSVHALVLLFRRLLK